MFPVVEFGAWATSHVIHVTQNPKITAIPNTYYLCYQKRQSFIHNHYVSWSQLFYLWTNMHFNIIFHRNICTSMLFTIPQSRRLRRKVQNSQLNIGTGFCVTTEYPKLNRLDVGFSRPCVQAAAPMELTTTVAYLKSAKERTSLKRAPLSKPKTPSNVETP